MPVEEMPVPTLFEEVGVPMLADDMPVPTLFNNYATGADFWLTSVWMSAILIILVIWSAVWKAMALWRSARNNHLAWFIVLMILNTAGILDILYYFIWGKKKSEVPGAPIPPSA
jgi:hypothetical protein